MSHFYTWNQFSFTKCGEWVYVQVKQHKELIAKGFLSHCMNFNPKQVNTNNCTLILLLYGYYVSQASHDICKSIFGFLLTILNFPTDNPLRIRLCTNLAIKWFMITQLILSLSFLFIINWKLLIAANFFFLFFVVPFDCKFLCTNQNTNNFVNVCRLLYARIIR